MNLTQKKRMYRLADLIENDGKPFDYDDEKMCAIPRGRKVSGLKFFNNDSVPSNSFRLWFGIKNESNVEDLFNLHYLSHLNRKAVANRFRRYADKHYKKATKKVKT